MTNDQNRPPTQEELAGPEPRMLDQECVVKEFWLMSQEEARRRFATIGYSLAEGFMWMAPGGLRYYLPPALEYLKSGEATGDTDFAFRLLCSLAGQVEMRLHGPLPDDVLGLFREVAEYCDANRARLKLESDPTLDWDINAIRTARQ